MTASAIDLTDLATVKDWLSPGAGQSLASDNDALLQRLITACSSFILNFTGRQQFDVASYDDRYDTGGRNFLMLRHYPVVAVTSIEFCGISITAEASGNPPTGGYILEPILPGGGQQRLTVTDYNFPVGRGLVRVQYSAGYTTVPLDVAQACVEMVGERFRSRERIGQVSKHLANGETVTFSQKDMNDHTRSILQPYMRVAPS